MLIGIYSEFDTHHCIDMYCYCDLNGSLNGNAFQLLPISREGRRRGKGDMRLGGEFYIDVSQFSWRGQSLRV